MSDYTPTTEYIRTQCLVTQYAVDDRDPAGTAAGFDRWLAEHDREVAEAAWDEGCAAARLHAEQERRGSETRIVLTNPYRKEHATLAIELDDTTTGEDIEDRNLREWMEETRDD